MSRIAARFEALKGRGRTALIPFVTAGDPGPEVTVPLMHAMVAAGADLIELGVPFSDPIADGPVIQRATERALAKGVSLHDVIALVREFRTRDTETPVVLMGYLNPIEVLGYAGIRQRGPGVPGWTAPWWWTCRRRRVMTWWQPSAPRVWIWSICWPRPPPSVGSISSGRWHRASSTTSRSRA